MHTFWQQYWIFKMAATPLLFQHIPGHFSIKNICLDTNKLCDFV